MRLVIGHEALAEVVEVGADVESVKPGDLVVPMVRCLGTHAKCVACRAGRQDFCLSGDFQERGIKHVDGFLTEFVVEEQQYLIPVPRALADVAVFGGTADRGRQGGLADARYPAAVAV